MSYVFGAVLAFGKAMAHARPVTAGNVLMLTRRVNERVFRLRPDRLTNQIVLYCMAYAAQETHVRVLAFGAMSNHVHSVVQDVQGNSPDYFQRVHMLTTKALNVVQGRKGSMWEPKQTSAVLLAERADVLEAIAYTAANPVKAGLVRRPEDWPGVMVYRRGTVTVKKPPVYFGRDFPDEIEVSIEPPTCSEHDPEGWFREVEEAVQRHVREAVEAVLGSGRKFLGAKRVLATPITAKPSEPEPDKKLNPTVAAKDPTVRRALLEWLKGFRAAYHEALKAWREGQRQVAFPFGTWWMRVQHHAEVAPAPG